MLFFTRPNKEAEQNSLNFLLSTFSKSTFIYTVLGYFNHVKKQGIKNSQMLQPKFYVFQCCAFIQARFKRQ